MSKYTKGMFWENVADWSAGLVVGSGMYVIHVFVKCHLRLVTFSFSCFGYSCWMLPKIIVQYKATYCTCITFLSKRKLKIKGHYLLLWAAFSSSKLSWSVKWPSFVSLGHLAERDFEISCHTFWDTGPRFL